MTFRPFSATRLRRFAVIAVAAAALAACNAYDFPKEMVPVPSVLKTKMRQLGMKETSQIFIRIFKEESELELWKERKDGTFALLKTYEICKWSGQLGPKVQEGDRQAPEGFYTVTPAQMNPNSSYYLSFNIGYPNAYDRALGRTGSNLMVHGACSSAGCYSMTDEYAGELFALARDSFRGGQTSFQIQAFPFRMTPENLARHRNNPNLDFWRNLKLGYDHFEVTRRPPKVDVCDRRYVFDINAGGAPINASAACPAYTVPAWIEAAVQKKQATDELQFRASVAVYEQQDQKADDEQRIAVAREAQEQQRAAEQAASPSLISRIVGAVTGQEPEPQATPVTPAFAAEPAPAVAPAPTVVGSVPDPQERPAETQQAATTAAVPTPPQPLLAPATAGVEPVIKPEMTPQSPPVGTFVKRKFLWQTDEGAGQDG